LRQGVGHRLQILAVDPAFLFGPKSRRVLENEAELIERPFQHHPAERQHGAGVFLGRAAEHGIREPEHLIGAVDDFLVRRAGWDWEPGRHASNTLDLAYSSAPSRRQRSSKF